MSSVTAKYAVVIPSHRRPEMLKRAVRSVFHQTLAPQAVFLIVDEEDNREAYSFLKTFDKRLHLEFTGGGFGGAKARNVGLDLIAEEDFEYIFFLDDDDEWLPNKVECQIQRLLDEPDAICVTCWNYKVSAAQLSGNHDCKRSISCVRPVSAGRQAFTTLVMSVAITSSELVLSSSFFSRHRRKAPRDVS